MRSVSILYFILTVGFAPAQTPDWAWARAAGGTGIDAVNDMAADAAGNVYATGFFSGSAMQVGTVSLSNPAAGQQQFFVAKFDRTGKVLWAKSAGGSGDDRGRSIAVDNSGNVYVCGEFQSATIAFGASTHTNASNPGQSDIFLVRYNASGAVVWSDAFGGGLQEEVNDLAADGAGNLAMTGNFYSLSVLFDNFGVINGGASDAFVVKFNNSGAAQWAKRIGGGQTDNGKGVAIDNSGNVYVTGDYNSSSVNSHSPALGNSGGFDVYVAKYSSSGSALFASRFGGSGDELASAMHGSPAGDFFVAGNFASASIQVGSVTLNNSVSRSMFVARFNSSGTAQWAQRILAGPNSSPSGLHGDGAALYMTGNFDNSSLAFGSVTVPNGGGQDLFVAAYATSGGAAQWARSSNNPGFEQSNAVAVSGGNAHVAGLFTGTLMLRDETLTATGASDGFVAKLCLPPAAPVSATGATVCPGLSLQLSANVPSGTEAVWFASAAGGSPLHVGPGFSAIAPGTFYVASRDTNAGCGMFSGTRIAVTGTHHPLPQANVSVSGHTLQATGSGSVAGWYDCAVGATLTGQNGPTFVLDTSGQFAVIMVSAQGCRDTSACKHYSYVPAVDTSGHDTTIVIDRIAEPAHAPALFTVFPNPAPGYIAVHGEGGLEGRVLDVYGAMVERFRLINGEAPWRSRRLAPGIYFVVSGDMRSVRRVIVLNDDAR